MAVRDDDGTIVLSLCVGTDRLRSTTRHVEVMQGGLDRNQRAHRSSNIRSEKAFSSATTL